MKICGYYYFCDYDKNKIDNYDYYDACNIFVIDYNQSWFFDYDYSKSSLNVVLQYYFLLYFEKLCNLPCIFISANKKLMSLSI